MRQDFRIIYIAHCAYRDYQREHRLMKEPLVLEIVGTILAVFETWLEGD